jgi:hypothetical protein
MTTNYLQRHNDNDPMVKAICEMYRGESIEVVTGIFMTRHDQAAWFLGTKGKDLRAAATIEEAINLYKQVKQHGWK